MGLEKLDLAITNFKIEYEKFTRGNNSAGTRARKLLQELKKAAQEIRDEIQNTRATKTEEPKTNA